MGQKRPTKKTDYGTVVLHWLLVGTLVVAIATGLRIAGEAPGRKWINIFDFILPKTSVWTLHLQAAVLLIAISVAYGVYVSRVHLAQRFRLDTVRLRGLLGRRYARWGTINIFLHWTFFLMMVSQLATGALLYFGHGGSLLVQIHWIGMWAIIGYVILHLFSQWQYGGAAQLLRILRPARPTAVPQFELVDVLALLDEHAGRSHAPNQSQAKVFTYEPVQPQQAAAPGHGPIFQRLSIVEPEVVGNLHGGRGSGRDTIKPKKHKAIRLNSFILASLVAGLTVVVMLTSERQIIDHLHIYRVTPAEVPIVDGETSDPVWRKIPPIYVLTTSGGNFQGTGETTVSIQAAHDELHAYFLFMWDDPTRSLKQLPLRKSIGGWEFLHDGYEIGDEHAYNEDKFSVLLTSAETILAGDVTFHAGASPAAGEPATLSGRGLHYTMHEGIVADVWEWKATSTNASKYCDDDHFGPPARGTRAEFAGLAPYRGGFASDPGSANYQDNFSPVQAGDYAEGVVPRRLPKDFHVLNAMLGRADLDPDHGESETARWYMTEEESAPYSPERDRSVPIGAVVPGVVISGEYSGDRADVRCAGRWGAGRWALEVVRRLDVNSPYDVPIRTGIAMRVAAFDHSQIRHTRHVRALRLEVE